MNRTLIMFSCFGLGLALSLGFVFGGVGLQIKQTSLASAGAWPNYHVEQVAEGAPLFTTNGINPATAAALMEILDHEQFKTPGPKTAADFSIYAGETDPMQPAAVYLKLFETVGEGNVESFTAQTWQLVYMSSGVLTLYMSEGYCTSVYGSATYGSSTVRSALVGDFDSVLANFGQSIPDMIVLPTAENVAWQQGQPNTVASGTSSFNNQTPPATDKVWLASLYEVTRTNYNGTHANTPISETPGGNLSNSGRRTGFWGFNGFDRRGSIGEHNNWLRSVYVTDTSSAGWTGSVSGSTAPVGGGHERTLTNYVRPAIHIDLTQLAAYSKSWTDYQDALKELQTLRSDNAALTQQIVDANNLLTEKLAELREQLETQHASEISDLMDEMQGYINQISALNETISAFEECTHPDPTECNHDEQAYLDAITERDALLGQLAEKDNQLNALLQAVEPGDANTGIDPWIFIAIGATGLAAILVCVTIYLGVRLRQRKQPLLKI